MRYRKLDENGDYTFGRNNGNFYLNNPEAVAQAVKTRLGLIQGEWFLDITVGTPYNSRILGAGMVATYDAAIQEVIIGTQGVSSILDYASNVDPSTRAATISCKINTIYGQAIITATL